MRQPVAIDPKIVDVAREMAASGFGRWKEIAALFGVNLYTLRYHAIDKLNPNTREVRKRAWEKWRQVGRPRRRA